MARKWNSFLAQPKQRAGENAVMIVLAEIPASTTTLAKAEAFAKATIEEERATRRVPPVESLRRLAASKGVSVDEILRKRARAARKGR